MCSFWSRAGEGNFAEVGCDTILKVKLREWAQSKQPQSGALWDKGNPQQGFRLA